MNNEKSEDKRYKTQLPNNSVNFLVFLELLRAHIRNTVDICFALKFNSQLFIMTIEF